MINPADEHNVTPIHAGRDHQYLYVPGRAAVAHYTRNYRRADNLWYFEGWLWDGDVTSAADGRARLASLLRSFPTMGE